jgi:sialic acid synthase SpsE
VCSSDLITGSGDLSLNHGELQYSQVGPMKMSPFATKDLDKNDIISEGDFDFIRTSQVGGVTQIGSISMIGKALNKDIKKGRVLKDSDLI